MRWNARPLITEAASLILNRLGFRAVGDIDMIRRRLLPTLLRRRALWLFLIVPTAGDAVAQENPVWSSDRRHRLLVQVEPPPDMTRASDEMVARVALDFGKYLGDQRADLSSLQLVAVSPSSGKPLEFAGNAYASTPGDRPLRFYDATIPWDYHDHEGYAHNTEGMGTPLREMPGGLRFFNPTGGGRQGSIAWAHTQIKSDRTLYAIYFNALADGQSPTPAPAGFIGDGVNRCTRSSDTFAPVLQGRVAVADLDGDARFDLLVGNATGTILWYPNLGTSGHPRFDQARLLFADDGQAIDVSWSSAPVAADWDGDGDLDLIVGAEKEVVVHFENVGNARSPSFRMRGLLQTDGHTLRIPKSPCEEDPDNRIYPIDYYGVPEVADWDGDGDLDLLVGGYITGRVWFYENIGADAKSLPQLAFRGALQAEGRDLDVGWCASPCAVDLDGDGDLDLLSGAMQISAAGGDAGAPDKFLWYYDNVGTRSAARLVRRPFPAQGQFAYGALATPRSIDFTADGLPDLIVSVNGLLLMLPNIGTSGHPRFDATTPPTPGVWGNAQLGFNQLVDYNGDGWPDLFSSLSRIVLNTGQGAPGLFEQSIPLGGADRILHPSPSGDHWDYRTLADLDGDGQRDILLGDHAGCIWFHRNLGTEEKPRMDIEGVKLLKTDGQPVQVGLPPPDVAPFDVLQGARTAVTTGDFNHDGRTDLGVCDTYGFLRVFLQTGGNPPAFELAVQIEKLQPTRLTAQRIDWNGDGWDDLLASYANDRMYLLVNRRAAGRPEFETPRLLNVPPCFGDPWPYVADWNHDGDDDLIIDQYGYTRFVERSFIDHGYCPGTIVRHEHRPSTLSGE